MSQIQGGRNWTERLSYSVLLATVETLKAYQLLNEVTRNIITSREVTLCEIVIGSIKNQYEIQIIGSREIMNSEISPSESDENKRRIRGTREGRNDHLLGVVLMNMQKQ